MQQTQHNSIPDSAFRLRWRRTWPGDTHPGAQADFVARDGADYCRINREQGGPQDGRWGRATAGGNLNLGTGYADSAREAAHTAEQAYFKWKERDAAMRVVRDTIAEAKLVPWEGDSHPPHRGERHATSRTIINSDRGVF